MSCRATAAGGCSGPSPTGALYTYDNEGRLAQWANKPTGATVTATELYDGSGERVERQTTSSGVLTSSVYVGALAEYDTTGSSTATTDYFSFAGQTIAIYDTTYHYLVADQLGTPEVQLTASGTPELVALKLPYGSGRYAAASLANLGFTGQRKDTSPNLTYMHARYYDQDVGVFLSPDSVTDGPNPYGYVGGMVENATDPSGNMQCNLTCQSVGFVGTGDGGPNGAVIAQAFAQTMNFLFGTTAIIHDVQTLGNGQASGGDKVLAGLDLAGTAGMDLLMYTGIGEVARGAELGAEAGADVLRASDEAARLAVEGGDEAESALARLESGAEQVAASGDNETERALARDGAGEGDTGGRAGGSGAGDTGGTTPPTTDPATPATFTNEHGTGGDFSAGDAGNGGGNDGGAGGPSGGQSDNPLSDIQYTPKVQRQMNTDRYHGFPSIVDNYGGLGERSVPPSGDGLTRLRIRIAGTYNGLDGVFEYIIEPDGVTVNHRLFVPIAPGS